MAHAERAVDEAAADADYLDICLRISAVIADLFKTAKSREIADRIGENSLALKSHTCGDRGHILLSDSGVYELIGELLPIGLQHTEA